jgi:hypothetical protein
MRKTMYSSPWSREMHVALGRLHLTVALEKRGPDRRAAPETSGRDRVMEDSYRQAQIRQEAEADRERWRNMSLPPGWWH